MYCSLDASSMNAGLANRGVHVRRHASKTAPRATSACVCWKVKVRRWRLGTRRRSSRIGSNMKISCMLSVSLPPSHVLVCVCVCACIDG